MLVFCSVGSSQTIADIIHGMREEMGMEEEDAGTVVCSVMRGDCSNVFPLLQRT